MSYISLNCIIFGQQPSVAFLPQRYDSRQHYVGRVLHFMFKNFTQMETQLCLNIKHFYIYIDTMPTTFCECYNSCGCIFCCTQLEKNKRWLNCRLLLSQYGLKRVQTSKYNVWKGMFIRCSSQFYMYYIKDLKVWTCLVISIIVFENKLQSIGYEQTGWILVLFY